MSSLKFCFAIVFVSLLLVGCTTSQQASEGVQQTQSESGMVEEVRTEGQSAAVSANQGPLSFNCVLTADAVKQTCGIDLDLTATRYDRPVNNILVLPCSVSLPKTVDATSTRYSSPSGVVVSYGVARFNKIIPDFEAFKATRINDYRAGLKDSEDLPGLGDSAFITYRRLNDYGTYENYEDSPAMGLYALKDNLVYTLEFDQQGQRLVRIPGDVADYARTNISLCSIQEGKELMNVMLSQMLSEPETQTQPGLAGCALTPEIIKQSCGMTNLREGVELKAFYLGSEARGGTCTVSASLPNSADSVVARFEEIPVSQMPSAASGEELSGIGDAAVAVQGDRGTTLYFQVGERAARFSAVVEPSANDVLVYDPDLQRSVPIGGYCNLEEAKSVVRDVLVPFLSR